MRREAWSFQLIALVVAASIVAHSSTDVLIARCFRTDQDTAQPEPAVGEDRRPVGSKRAGQPDRAEGGQPSRTPEP